MELITYYLNQGLSFIIPLVILLGLLIFVHELGHFLVAKYYGVRVEVFSLGFGKKFFTFKRGDTEYCLSIVPFGGYVKMYGDDPTAEVPAEDRKYSFTHKPVGQRIAIVLAGPLMNLFFAALLFFVIALVGEQVISPLVGDISPKSPAYEFGFRPGDEVLSVNNQPVTDWQNLKAAVEENGEGPIVFSVKTNAGELKTIQASTRLIPNPNPISSELQVGDVEGLSFLFRSTTVATISSSSYAASFGIQTNDRITSVNGVKVERWKDLAEQVAAAFTAGAKNITFTLERDEARDKVKSFVAEIDAVKVSAVYKAALIADEKAAPPDNLRKLGEDLLSSIGLDVPDLYVSNVLEGSAAAQAGIKKGDKIVQVDEPITEWSELVKKVQSYKEGQSPFKVTYVREGKEFVTEVAPKKTPQTAPNGKEIDVFAMGVVAGVAAAMPVTFLERTSNPAKAAQIAVHDTWEWSKNTVLSFLRLIQNRVSAKSIGGPIMIGQLASKTFEIGLSPFLKIMAIISINLFILNLLPIPVLDGGHLVFFTVEALRGAPLSMRKMEIAQQVGLVLLMSLMFLALFNDVSRLFE